MGRPRNFFYLFIILLITCLAIFLAWSNAHYLLLSFLLVVLALALFLKRFSWNNLDGRGLVLLAMLASLGAAGRVVFAVFPGAQPMSFVIISTGLVFGPEAGSLVGAVGALVSNIFLGQGPWTPWQMLAWSMMGISTGFLKDTVFLQNDRARLLFGFVWGFIFGWIMNSWFVISFLQPLTWKTLPGAYAAGFYFDLIHAMANVFFPACFGNP